MKKGIDVSYHQGTIDFDKVKNSGVEFVIFREGYRNRIDTKFVENVKKATEAGLPIMGVYHFSYALNIEEAKEEARTCVENLERAGLGKDVIVFFDFEYDTVNKAADAGVILGPAECNAHTVAFCEEVKSLGYTPGIYYNISYRNNWYTADVRDKYVSWLADWTGEADYDCVFHQYSSTGKVPGITGNVDMNYYYGDQASEEEDIGVTAEDVLNVARGWIGLSEDDGSFKEILDTYNAHKPLARGYAIKVDDEWCDAFVSAVAIKAGAVGLIGTEVGCEKHLNIFKKLGIWNEDGSMKPEPGDVILFNWGGKSQPNDGISDHIGYVDEVYDNSFATIEGNVGRKVSRRIIEVGWGPIRGFARPKYAKTEKPAGKPSKGESTPGPSPAPTPTKTIDEIANEVIRGLWGNGADRKKALTEAGYDYEAVQARVTEILTGKSTVKKTVDEIAKEVIAGKWGNGTKRRKALIAAGYDYDEVQAAVNRILCGKSNEDIAKEVIAGKWGNGADRRKALTRAGYDYDIIQELVNKLLSK